MVTCCFRQAYLQFESEEQAKTMARFYNTNVTASVCGRPVRISHSTSYPTIQVSSAPCWRTSTPDHQSVPFQCGSSKVVYIGNIPSSSFSDESILKLAEPFGRVCKYFTNRIKREVLGQHWVPSLSAPPSAPVAAFYTSSQPTEAFLLSSGVHRNGER